MKKFTEFLSEDIKSIANWVFPSDKSLKQEYDVEYKYHLIYSVGNIFPTFNDFKQAVKKSKIELISQSKDNSIINRSHSESVKSLLNLISGYASYPQYRNERTLEDLDKKIKTGQTVDLPIIIKKINRLTIFSGNTRADISNWYYTAYKAIILDISNL